MNHRSPLLATAIVALCLLAAAGPSTAVGARLEVLDPSVPAHPDWGATDPGRPISVVVALDGPTALDEYLASGGRVGDTSAKARRALDEIYARLAARQAPARRAVVDSGATLVSTYDTAANGFLVRATTEQIGRITRAPGVRRVYRAPVWQPALKDAVPHVGAQGVAQELGYQGLGSRVAIIDTGIDYYHDSLGGSGRVADFKLDNPGETEEGTYANLRVNSSPASLAAYREGVADPYWLDRPQFQPRAVSPAPPGQEAKP